MRDGCGHHGNHLSSLTRDLTAGAREVSLELLNAVDMTVETHARLQHKTREALNLVRACVEAIQRCEPQAMIDPDLKRAKALETAEQALAVERETLKLKLAAAHEDDRLSGDHEESVVTEYEATIGLSETLHDAIVELRWAVLEHDADLDGGKQPNSSKGVLSVSDLMRELRDE